MLSVCNTSYNAYLHVYLCLYCILCMGMSYSISMILCILFPAVCIDHYFLILFLSFILHLLFPRRACWKCYMHIYVHINMPTYICIYIYLHMFTCIYVYSSTHIYLHISTYIYRAFRCRISTNSKRRSLQKSIR